MLFAESADRFKEGVEKLKKSKMLLEFCLREIPPTGSRFIEYTPEDLDWLVPLGLAPYKSLSNSPSYLEHFWDSAPYSLFHMPIEPVSLPPHMDDFRIRLRHEFSYMPPPMDRRNFIYVQESSSIWLDEPNSWFTLTVVDDLQKLKDQLMVVKSRGVVVIGKVLLLTAATITVLLSDGKGFTLSGIMWGVAIFLVGALFYFFGSRRVRRLDKEAKQKALIPRWEVVESKSNDGVILGYHVRWSIPENESFLWVRHYMVDPKEPGNDRWCKNAAERNAAQFNEQKRQPEEFERRTR